MVHGMFEKPTGFFLDRMLARLCRCRFSVFPRSDKHMWHHSSNGIIQIKSGYWCACSNDDQAYSVMIKRWRKTPCSDVRRAFRWCACYEGLPATVGCF